jgi:hypothetical protein
MVFVIGLGMAILSASQAWAGCPPDCEIETPTPSDDTKGE